MLHSRAMSFCIETRIVEFEVKYNIEATRLGAHKVLGMKETGRP